LYVRPIISVSYLESAALVPIGAAHDFNILKGGLLKMKVKPLNDRVLVLRIGEEEKTSGGIIIPDTAKEKPQEGKVIAAGPGKVNDEGKKVALDVKAGDKVLFGKYSGTEIKIDGVEHLIMREDDILAIIEK
jgi:chaperonin GroES